MQTGQWFVDYAGTRWFFDSGSLALDFGYTGDYGYGRPEWERLHGASDLTAWLTERFGDLVKPATSVQFRAAVDLRTAIATIAMSLADDSAPDPDAVDLINEAAATADLAPTLTGGTESPPAPAVSRALSTIARDAVRVFSGGTDRIRRCGADDCALIFYDSSRPNARRWCSMQRCGNRTKVRTHRSHRKEHTE